MSSNQAASQLYSDNQITQQVLKIIEDAKEEIAIVSPYVDRVPHVEQAIARAVNNGVDVVVFVRQDGNELGGRQGSEAVEWFRSENIRVVGIPHLHAKFYMNERGAVVTSMNLLKSSWTGSLELGIVATGDVYDQLVTYLKQKVQPTESYNTLQSPKRNPNRARSGTSSIRNSSKPRSKATSKQQPNKGFMASVFSAVKDFLEVEEGFCIRCGDKLSESETASGKTMCRKDYVSWAKFKNPDFKEKYCTTCGSESRTTFSKPQCEDCFAEYR